MYPRKRVEVDGRMKVKHPNKTRAQAEITRIRQENGGGGGTERLQMYYSYEARGWFIGKAKKRAFYY